MNIEVDAQKKKMLAQCAYGSIVLTKRGFRGVLVDVRATSIADEQCMSSQATRSTQIRQWLKRAAKKHHVKIVAVGLVEASGWEREPLGARLWLVQDIVPHLVAIEKRNAAPDALSVAREIHEQYDGLIARIHMGKKREVIPSFLTTLREFRRVADEGGYEELQKQATLFKQEKGTLVFVSSTPAGGGVALMRHALIRLYRLLGLDVHWYVMKPKEEVFNITKRKFHNILQAITSKSETLTATDKKVYRDWIAENAKGLRTVLRRARVVVIDDPQPSGLITFIKAEYPDVKVIYRSHIQLRTDLMARVGTPQERTWGFLKSAINQADVFVSHPIPQFIPRDIPKKKVVLMPATTDFLDGLNKSLTVGERRYYHRVFNELLIEDGQTSLVSTRPYIIQVARFDPSKGIPDVIEAYRRLRKKLQSEECPLHLTPQLVIVGNGAIDDPDGVPMLQEIRFLLEMDRYRSIANDIKVARVPHIDQLLNTLLSDSMVALQLSHREGFEIKVTEALNKERPVIAYRTGGIPLQIHDGVTGYLVRTGDAKKVSEHLYHLVTEASLYRGFVERTAAQVYARYGTVANATRWLFLANELMTKGAFFGNGRPVEGYYR